MPQMNSRQEHLTEILSQLDSSIKYSEQRIKFFERDVARLKLLKEYIKTELSPVKYSTAQLPDPLHGKPII